MDAISRHTKHAIIMSCFVVCSLFAIANAEDYLKLL